jgi:HEPN domain-containing protein
MSSTTINYVSYLHQNIMDEQKMTVIKSIANWIESSNYDIKTADHMFETKRYVYVLFMCHLATEKLIKALYEATTKEVPPRTHNLVSLLDKIALDVPDEYLKTIESLNDVSIVTRYPGDIKALVKAFNKERAGDYLQKTKMVLKWLKKDERLKK